MIRDYRLRYENFAKMAGNTISEFEYQADKLSLSAAEAVKIYERENGLPTQAQLKDLSKKLGVSQICIINNEGLFIRDSLVESPEQSKTLFDFCAQYRQLLTGESAVQHTPVIPSYPDRGPFKFTMIPNHNRSLILEIGLKIDYIADFLSKSLLSDSNIVKIQIFSPNGYNLGSIDKSRKPWSGDSISPDFLSNIETWSENKDIHTYVTKVHHTLSDCCECKVKNLVDKNGNFFYLIAVQVSTSSLNRTISELRSKILLIGLLVMILAVALAHFLANLVLKKIRSINSFVSKIITSNDLSLRLNVGGTDEIAHLSRNFDLMLENLESQQKRLLLAEKDKAIASLASQVAHDIRSPVAALEIVVKDLGLLPERQRLIVRGALSRIKDIANDLLDKNRSLSQKISINENLENNDISKKGNLSKSQMFPTGHHFSLDNQRSMVGEMPTSTVVTENGEAVSLISELIEAVVSEKRIQYRSKIGVEIIFDISEACYGLFALIKPSSFQRVLSNLINNAVEALGEQGRVEVILSSKDSLIFVTVRDNGRGIPQELLQRLGERGFTLGKVDGHGLGLAHAKHEIADWGRGNGRLEILSTVGKGTDISIILPAERHSNWFLSEISYYKDTVIVIVDDDITIHNVWASRFENIPNGSELLLQHFTDPKLFMKEYSDHSILSKSQYLFLVDYEFIGSDINGLDIIEKLKIASLSVLVTSRTGDQNVIQRCESLGVVCIPKGLASIVPVNLKDEKPKFENEDLKSPDVVLLDDEYLMREYWSLICSQRDLTIRVFSNPESLFEEATSFSSETIFFVDVSLDRFDIDGVDVTKKLFSMGFTHLYLSTGCLESEFEGLSFIKGIVNKEVPDWLRKGSSPIG